MIPIVLDGSKVCVAIVGEGARALNRLRLLARHGCRPWSIFAPEPCAELVNEAGPLLQRRWPTSDDLVEIQVLFAADLGPEEIEALEQAAKAAKILLNVEDATASCGFHVPAAVRHGHLLLTASTDGASPALARRIARQLDTSFGPEWADRVRDLGEARRRWQAEGLPSAAIAERTEALVTEKEWLP